MTGDFGGVRNFLFFLRFCVTFLGLGVSCYMSFRKCSDFGVFSIFSLINAVLGVVVKLKINGYLFF